MTGGSVESGKKGDGKRTNESETDSMHGAPSVAKLTTHSDLLSSLVREAALSSVGDESSSSTPSSVPELMSLPPSKVAAELLGFSTNSPSLGDLSFINMDGKGIGSSPLSFAKAWNVSPHKDAYYDAVLWPATRPEKGRRRFNYDVELTFQYIEGSRNSEADRLSRLSSTLPSLNIGKTGGRDALNPVLEKTTKPSCPAHVNMMMVTSCAQDVFTVGPHLWSSHRCLHPIDVAEATDCRPVPTVSLAVCDDQTKSESSAFVDLTTVGNMTEADIVRHMASACDCPEYAENVEVVRGITVYDILVALNVLSDSSVKPGARSLCEGPRASFRWDADDKVLRYRDFKVSPDWYIYLFTPRARAWTIYHFHHAPLTGCHRSAARCLQAVLAAGFYFPRIGKVIRRAVERCRTCQLSKTGGANPTQPFSYRRGSPRFAEIQLDFLGPLKDADGVDSDPNACPYLVLIVDCASNFALGFPVASTSTNCVIYGLLQWIAIMGRPRRVQLDSPPSHSSEELRRFLEVMNITRSLGIARRPQCQGRIENVVKEVKTALRCNSTDRDGNLPWWVVVQTSLAVHNSSRMAPHGFSPSEIVFGVDRPIFDIDFPPKSSDEISERWDRLYNEIADVFYICSIIQSDDSHLAEMQDLVRKSPVRVYKVGDSVRLSRVEDGHRVIRGPFVISALHESNPYLYRLDGWSQGWVSLGQLLPYRSDEELRDFNHAVKPHQAYSASTFRLALPADVGIPSSDISVGDFVIYPLDEDVTSSTSAEPRRTLYILEVMSRDGDTIQALSLNKDSKGRYKRPLVRDRPDFTWTIDVSSVLGAFKPTKTRRLPSKVISWLDDHGAEAMAGGRASDNPL